MCPLLFQTFQRGSVLVSHLDPSPSFYSPTRPWVPGPAAARARAISEFDDRCVIATTLRTYEWLLAARSPLARVSASA